MEQVLALRSLLEPHDLTFFAGQPYVYHCHHYNLFHDQTVDDVLGEELGLRVRKRAAQAATGELMRRIYEQTGATLPVERARLAEQLIAHAGHGRIAVDPTTLKAEGTHLHYGLTWLEKYGKRVKRLDPVDGVATGYAAAIAGLARGEGIDAFDADEVSCVAMRAPRCSFELKQQRVSLPPTIDENGYKRHLGEDLSGLWEAEIANIAKGLQGFVSGVAGDDRGLVQAFGVYVTMHLANYYNETAFAALHHAKKQNPGIVSWVESLLREAGHVCVFNTFGGILLSPEWEGMVGALSGDPGEIVKGCTAIARGLGFGSWSVHEFEEGKRVVIRSASTYEAPWYVERYGVDTEPRSYFFQGAALAFAVLAHRVKWRERPALTQEYYDQLFRGEGLGWNAEATRCVTKGDPYSEVVVTRR